MQVTITRFITFLLVLSFHLNILVTARFNCTSNERCDFDCDGKRSCYNEYIDCARAEECSLYCGGKNACYNATINGTLSKYLHVTIYASANVQVAKYIKIFCPIDEITDTRNCQITCDGWSLACDNIQIFAIDGSLVFLTMIID